MKLIKKIFTGSLITLAVTGCSMTSEPYSIDTAASNIPDRSFVFEKVQDEGIRELDEQSVINAVRKYVKDNSAFNKCSSGLFGGNCTKTGSSGIRDNWGSNVTNTGNAFNVVYYSEKTYSTGRSDRATIEQRLPYTISTSEDAITLLLTPPTSAQAKPTSDAIGLPYSVPISDENVLAWTKALFERESTAEIAQTIHRTGEFDVSLDPDSVRANLFRKFDLELTESSSDIQWKARATRHLEDARVNISLVVSLYRGNTKIEYTLTHPFEVHSNGEVHDYNDEIIDIALKQLIEAANA